MYLYFIKNIHIITVRIAEIYINSWRQVSAYNSFNDWWCFSLDKATVMSGASHTNASPFSIKLASPWFVVDYNENEAWVGTFTWNDLHAKSPGNIQNFSLSCGLSMDGSGNISYLHKVKKYLSDIYLIATKHVEVRRIWHQIWWPIQGGYH